MHKAFIIFLLILHISCGYRVLVDKKHVVNQKSGYLIFVQDYAIFSPSKDTVDRTFLLSRKPEGYIINYERLAWLDSLAIDYSKLAKFPTANKFSIIPVTMIYYLGDDWERLKEYNDFTYKLDNKEYKIRYRTFDARFVIGIRLRRLSDLIRLRRNMNLNF